MGLCFAKENLLNEAVHHYRKAVEKSPDEATWFNHLGNTCRIKKDYPGALVAL
jgi:hypothetical protein